jgi:hypothetical protein
MTPATERLRSCRPIGRRVIRTSCLRVRTSCLRRPGQERRIAGKKALRKRFIEGAGCRFDSMRRCGDAHGTVIG